MRRISSFRSSQPLSVDCALIRYSHRYRPAVDSNPGIGSYPLIHTRSHSYPDLSDGGSPMEARYRIGHSRSVLPGSCLVYRGRIRFLWLRSGRSSYMTTERRYCGRSRGCTRFPRDECHQINEMAFSLTRDRFYRGGTTASVRVRSPKRGSRSDSAICPKLAADQLDPISDFSDRDWCSFPWVRVSKIRIKCSPDECPGLAPEPIHWSQSGASISVQDGVFQKPHSELSSDERSQRRSSGGQAVSKRRYFPARSDCVRGFAGRLERNMGSVGDCRPVESVTPRKIGV